MHIHTTTRRPRTGRSSRALLAAAVAGTSIATLAVGGAAAPASAATRVTKYAFSATGFGTEVKAAQADLRSARTAYSLIGCTKAAGRSTSNSVAATNLNSQVKVGDITTNQATSVTSTGTTMVTSTTRVASIEVGDSTLGFRITGLKGVSRAYATKAGKLNATSTFTFTDLTPLGTTQLPPPLDQPADVILQQLASNGPVEIPNLGVVKMGRVAKAVSGSAARSGSLGLQIHLYGADQSNGTSDDSDVLIGRSYARITRSATYGVFSGSAWGIDGRLGSTAVLGRNPLTPMSCEGTYGKVKTRSLAGLDLAAQNNLVTGPLTNRVYGAQNTPKGGVTGWTESTVDSINLGNGQLRASGIVARAKVIRSSTDRMYKIPSQGVGSLTVNGTSHAVPKPGQSFTVPGVATVEVPEPVQTTYGVSVTGLRITLLGGSAANTVINLANAQIQLRRY